MGVIESVFRSNEVIVVRAQDHPADMTVDQQIINLRVFPHVHALESNH